MNKKAALIIFASFITGAVLAAVIFAFSEIYPGSSRTLLVFDMLEQFAAFYSSLKGLFTGNVTLSYTFQGSLGTSYTGTYAYYLASPVSFVTLLFDTKHLPDAIWLIDIIKAGLITASFSAFAWFRGVKRAVPNLVLSICYALSSATVTFFLLPMYLDTLYMLPLIAIFLEKMIKEKNGRKAMKAGIVYSAFLGIEIMIHYYSMYMVCIFLVMYAVYVIIEINSEQRECVADSKAAFIYFSRYLRFVFYSLAGVLISLPLLIPVIRELLKGKISDSGVYSTGSLIVTEMPDLLKQFVCGHYGFLYSEGAPYIYCTIIMLVLAVYGLVRGKERLQSKICAVVILLIFIFSFIFRPLYRIWHIFRDPVAYPHRFSFLFVFFVMVLAVKGMNELLDSIEKIINDKEKKFKICIRITGLLVSACCIALIIFNGVKITSASYDTHTLPYKLRWDYNNFLDMTEPLIERAQEDSAVREDCGVSLCRINKDFELSSNDPMLLGYNGMDLFSSSYDSNMLEFYKNLGIMQYHYKVCDQGTTLVTDMLLGTDYQIRWSDPEYGYETVRKNGYYTLYRNPYSLGIGYLGADDTCEFGKDSFQNQNSFISSVLGENVCLFEEIEYTERLFEFPGVARSGPYGEGDYYGSPMKVRKLYFAPLNDRNLYFNYELVREYELDYDSKANSVTMTIAMNDNIAGTFTGYQRASNTYLGRDSQDDDYIVELIGDQEERPGHIYALDFEQFKKAYEILNSGRFIADAIAPGHITGNVNVTYEIRNELIFTVSYDERYRAYVDGERVQTYAYAGGLLAIPDLAAGEHIVEVIYR